MKPRDITPRCYYSTVAFTIRCRAALEFHAETARCRPLKYCIAQYHRVTQ